MKNRSLIFLVVCSSVMLLASYTVLKTSGAHPGSTGAPGDLTCAQSGCHVTASVTQDSGLVNNLIYSQADSTYTPGNTYTLTVQATKPGISKFGFEMVALKDSSNTNIGNFTLLESTRTQKISHMAAGADLRFSMTHRTAGTTTSTPGAIEWKMRWTAPANNVGTITFWYATNCTNNNGQNTGDQVFLSHFQIKPFIPLDTTGSDTTDISGIEKNLPDQRYLRAYQESGSRYLSVNFSSYSKQKATIMLYDLGGKLLSNQEVEFVPGHNRHRMELPVNCCEGAYLVKVTTRDRVYSNKIVLQK